jgi:hypothetical protein
LKGQLPTVAVHEIAVHPTAGEIVAATHGRSVWILEVTPLRQFNAKLAAGKAHLFQPHEGVLWAGALSRSHSGHRIFTGKNPAFGSTLHYFLGEDAKAITLEIRDARGRPLRRLKASGKAGMHSVRWDLREAQRRAGPRPPQAKSPAADVIEKMFKQLDTDKNGELTDKDLKDAGPRAGVLKRILEQADKDKDGVVTMAEFKTRRGQNAGPTRRNAPPLNRAGRPVKPGNYVVSLKIDGEEFVREIRVLADPEFPVALLQEELEEQTRKQRQEFIE